MKNEYLDFNVLFCLLTYFIYEFEFDLVIIDYFLLVIISLPLYFLVYLLLYFTTLYTLYQFYKCFSSLG